MDKFISKFILLCCVFSSVNIAALDQNINSWSQGNRHFTTSFYPYMHEGMNSFVFSPISVQLNFAMVAEMTYGKTLKEILNTLFIPKYADIRKSGAADLLASLCTAPIHSFVPDETMLLPSLSIMNGAWLSLEIEPIESLKKTFREFYHSDLVPIDFQLNPEEARHLINQWVSSNTQDQIQELMEEGSITRDSKLVLVNTIFMRSPWNSPFDPEMTYEAPFYGYEKTLRVVPYMHKTALFGYLDKQDYQVIELPFKEIELSDNELSLYVVIPSEGHFLNEIESSLTTAKLNQWINDIESHTLDLSVPKFKVSSKVDAKEIFIKMGMERPFSSLAEFSLGNEAHLTIADVVHQAIFEVDELGGIGSAATGTSIGLTSFVTDPIQVVVNRPFMFLVVEKKQGIILFAGRVMRPVI